MPQNNEVPHSKIRDALKRAQYDARNKEKLVVSFTKRYNAIIDKLKAAKEKRKELLKSGKAKQGQVPKAIWKMRSRLDYYKRRISDIKKAEKRVAQLKKQLAKAKK